MNRIIVNKDLCIGCKICFKSCFIDILKWDEKARKPIVKYPEECVQCGFCELNCPKGAIKVEPDYDAYVFPREHICDMERGYLYDCAGLFSCVPGSSRSDCVRGDTGNVWGLG